MMKTKAFSLIELLVSLIIISLIATAFVPMLTKNIKHREVIFSQNNVSTDCTKLDAQNRCMMCTKTNCTFCTTQINIPDGYYIDPEKSCDYKKCSDNFAGCKSCNKDFCISCQDGYYYSNKSCIKCPQGCSSCTSSTICTKCSGEYRLENNTCKKMCIAVGNICVSRYNAGDSGGLSIPAGVEIRGTVAEGTAKTDYFISTSPVCWQGTTSGGCNAAHGGYSGCNRTVCTWYAAYKICQAHGWRLPSPAEMQYFPSYSSNKGVNGLQLCGNNSAYDNTCGGAFRCNGSHGGVCLPNYVWSSQQISETIARVLIYGGGSSALLYDDSNCKVRTNYAASVRCVKNL